MSMIDNRRLDVRDNVRGNPFWMSSKVFNYDDGAGMDDNETVLFQFKKASVWIIDQVIVEVENLFTGTSVMLLGNGTITTPDVADGATVSVVNADSLATTALFGPTATGRKTIITEDALATLPLVLKGALATVPVIYLTLTASSAVTAGRGRVHIRVSEVDENIL